jgi:hypothetical protein
VDPVLQLLLRAALAVLFAAAAAHKLLDMPTFRASLAAYGLVPSAFVPILSTLLVAGEVIVAMALLPPDSSSAAPFAAAALLLIYTSAILVNLLRGRTDIDCGCAGPTRRQSLGVGLVVRNLVLLSATLVSALPVSPRPLVWIDGFTFAAGLVSVCLLYKAVDALVADAVSPQQRRVPADEPVLSFEVQNG